MAYPTLRIGNGPGARDLEQAFLARNLGATVEFTIVDENSNLVKVRLRILNFSFVTCHGPKYKLGGHLVGLDSTTRQFLPPLFNFIFVEYDAEEREGGMEFSNGG